MAGVNLKGVVPWPDQGYTPVLDIRTRFGHSRACASRARSQRVRRTPRAWRDTVVVGCYPFFLSQ